MHHAGILPHRQIHKNSLRCEDRKSTRLNSSHLVISYAVFCLKKKNKTATIRVGASCSTEASLTDVTSRRTTPPHPSLPGSTWCRMCTTSGAIHASVRSQRHSF